MTARDTQDDIERRVIAAALLRADCCHELSMRGNVTDFTDSRRQAAFRLLGRYVVQQQLDGADVQSLEPWKVADGLGDDDLQKCGLDAETLRQWAGTGLDVNYVYFKADLAKLRRAAQQRAFSRTVSALNEIGADGVFDRGAAARGLREAEQAVADIDAGVIPSLHRIPVGELLNREQQCVPWVIDGWLGRGDICIIAGDGGVGKSWLLLDLAVRLCAGSTWLGMKVFGGKQRVLVVDEENNKLVVTNRLTRILKECTEDEQAAAGSNLVYLCDNGLSLDDDDAYRRLQTVVDEFVPHWIFFDSLVRFHQRDENNNTEMSAFYTKRLRPLARRNSSGLISLHHLGKPNTRDKQQRIIHRARGASDLPNQSDCFFGLEPSDGDLLLTPGKSRWGKLAPPVRYKLLDTLNDSGILLDVQPAREEDRQSITGDVELQGPIVTAEPFIVQCLHEVGGRGILRNEMVSLLERAGHRSAQRTVSRVLNNMFAHRQVGKLTEGNAVRYWLYDYSPGDAIVQSEALT